MKKKATKSLINHNFTTLHSNRASVSKKQKKAKLSISKISGLVVLIIIIFAVPTYAYLHSGYNKLTTTKIITPKPVAKKSTAAPVTSKTTPTATVTTTQTSGCSGNTISQVLITSISQRHLWACDGSTMVYQSAVVTGDMNVVADVTPVGTFHIYAKFTDQHLTGSDSRGSWDDFVNYWMPFLSNQYGVFGLHDATWRAPTDFGNISPYSDDASHGCIELPLATAAWVYNWSSIGTTVVVES